MRTTLLLVAANIRRGKGQAISLLAFVFIAALFLSTSLLLLFCFGSFFDKRSEELNAAHFILVEEAELYSPGQLDYLKEYPGVRAVESMQVISFMGTITYNNGEMITYLTFSDAEAERSMNPLTLIEGSRPITSTDICLPSAFMAGGGYVLGDTFEVTVGDEEFSYTVCGFTEEICLGSINNSMFQTYLSSLGYSELLKQMPEGDCMMLQAQLENPEHSYLLQQDSTKEFFYSSALSEMDTRHVYSLDIGGIKQVRTMMSSITAVILLIFASAIVLVSLLVIRFRIHNSIEESMHNIGALKAVGYTGSQLLWATVLQFCLLALVGAVAGVGVSYAVLPVVSGVLEQQTALAWQQGFDLPLASLTLAIILLAVFVVALLSARNIRNLQPLAALRQGLATHSFKKNHLPLDRSRGALTWLLALKALLKAKGQAAMVFVIVTAMSFMAVVGVSVYNNLGINSDSFARLLAGELPDVAFYAKTHEDAEAIRAHIERGNDASKTFYNQDVTVLIGDVGVSNIVVEDFALLEGTMLYEGRYPRHDNEICVSGALASRQGFIIGSTVEVLQGTDSKEYLVVGLIQAVNNGGVMSTMTLEGYQSLQPEFEPVELFVYLKDNTRVAEFIDGINEQFSEGVLTIINIQESLTAQLSMYGSIFLAVASVLLAVTILVIFLVLYLLLRTVIVRRRRELGIQKALGFTTLQLMNQLVLYFIPVIALGVVAGGLLGSIGLNPIFVALIQGMGIMTASMPTPLELVAVLCAALVLLAYLFALLITWRIRRISAYALIVE